jgi:hypothetical protein
MISDVAYGRDVGAAALLDPANPIAIVWPIGLMTVGVGLLVLIGHFAFRRESEEQRQSPDEPVTVTSDA